MSAPGSDLIRAYIAYATESSEVPATFHRWSIIASIGAMLGRRYYLQHGQSTLHPNFYCMLLGSPGTRKSSAIKLAKRFIKSAGYSTIAADKTTKEKFLLDLAGETGDAEKALQTPDVFLDQILFNDPEDKQDSEMFIMADEFNDFVGLGNIEFISLLGNLWDYEGVFQNRIKNSKSVDINNPTISILGGNTPTGFALAFPPESIGQGFFSRLLMIYGEPNGKRIAFPEPPNPQKTLALTSAIQEVALKVQGEAKLSPQAKQLLSAIYERTPKLEDVRFEHYYNRRFTHLLKLTLITSAARLSTVIEEQDVIFANTMLSYAEHLMPKALGEFGKARNSDVSHKIIALAESELKLLTVKEIWRHVASDLEKISDLAQILQNLVAADKLQQIEGKFLAKRRALESAGDRYVDYGLLTDEERSLIL